jgi:hypothetical protein
MADPTTPAPAASPAPASSPNPSTPASGSASSGLSSDGGAKAPPPNSPVPKDEPDVKLAANEVRSGNPIGRPRAGVITNPAPIVDLDAPRVEKLPDSVPQSTIDEMNAGRKALERNKPVATALENARSAKDAGVSTTPETNPVDATHSLQQQGKV